MTRSDWIRSALAQYEGALTRYATHLTGDVERARDVVQDTFLRLCSQKPSRVRDHLAQWLFTVCRNRALDVLRKDNRMSSPLKSNWPLNPLPVRDPPGSWRKKKS